MNSETELKQHIVKMMKAEGYYAKRVEDMYAVGTLDLIVAMPSTGLVVVEAKLIRNNLWRPTPRQFIEMERIHSAGGKTCAVGWKFGNYYFAGVVEQSDYRNLIAAGSFAEGLERHIRSYYGRS